MAFEIFAHHSVRVPIRRPQVTLSQQLLTFNNAATVLLRKNDFNPKVLLLWDRESCLVGVKPLQDADERAYELKPHGPKKTNGATHLYVQAFFSHIGYIGYNKDFRVRTFPAEWRDDMLVFAIPPEFLRSAQVAVAGNSAHNETNAKGAAVSE